MRTWQPDDYIESPGSHIHTFNFHPCHPCPQHNCDYRSLDDIVMKPNDQAVGEVGLELRGELLHHVVEPDG